ncbi:MAG: retropepsin-like aspartic protease family protein [Candidatus Acidiferrales bacterium]
MKADGGAYVVPVTINNAIKLNFIVDSGSADVSVPADVVLTLIRTGTIDHSDFLGNRTYQLADGSSLPSPVFRIRSLRVGCMSVSNVTASVSPVRATPLLGQSFLGRFRSWSVDNKNHSLVLKEIKGTSYQVKRN